jgi:hypothetical protein
MPRYLDTRGETKIAIAVCARCKVKYPWTALSPDPNSPGLMCCPDGCRDVLDPYRLPAREVDEISLPWARPDAALAPGPQAVPVLPLQGVVGAQVPDQALAADPPAGTPLGVGSAPVAVLQQPKPWTASTEFILGSQVTQGTEYGSTVAAADPFKTWICLVPGLSGPAPPAWNTASGTITTDNEIVWLCNGRFLP